MKLIVLAAMALCAAVPAAQAQSVDAPVKAKKPVDPNKRICRRLPSTGSIMEKSTCHTAAEWAEIDQTNAAAVRNTLDPRSQGIRTR